MSLFLPSYDNGFAPRDFAPEYPELWEGVVGAWCPSLGATGTTLFDQSGYVNNGTLTNFTLSTAWANPAVNGLQFTSASSTNVKLFPMKVPGSYRFSCWINTTFNGGVAACCNGALTTNLYLYVGVVASIGMANKATFGLYFSTSGYARITGTTTVTDGAWHFIECVYDSPTNKMSMYVDGNLDAGPTSGGTGVISEIGDYLFLGSESNGSIAKAPYWQGGIDDAQLRLGAYVSGEASKLFSIGRGGIYTPSSRQASLIPNIATGNRRRRVIIGAA